MCFIKAYYLLHYCTDCYKPASLITHSCDLIHLLSKSEWSFAFHYTSLRLDTAWLILTVTIKQHLPYFSWLTLTDPADVARVESKTVISTSEKRDTVPIPKEGVTGSLGRWISPDDMDRAYKERVPGCMKGKYSDKTNSWRAISL